MSIVSKTAAKVQTLRPKDYYDDKKCLLITRRISRIASLYDKALREIAEAPDGPQGSIPDPRAVAQKILDMAEGIALGEDEEVADRTVDQAYMYAGDKVPQFIANPEQRECVRDAIAQAFIEGHKVAHP